MIFDADVLVQDAIIRALQADAQLTAWTTAVPPVYRIYDGELAPANVSLTKPGPNNTVISTPYVLVSGGDEMTLKMLCEEFLPETTLRARAWHAGTGHRAPKVGRAHIARILSEPIAVVGYGLIEFDVFKVIVLTSEDNLSTQAVADITATPRLL